MTGLLYHSGTLACTPKKLIPLIVNRLMPAWALTKGKLVIRFDNSRLPIWVDLAVRPAHGKAAFPSRSLGVSAGAES